MNKWRGIFALARDPESDFRKFHVSAELSFRSDLGLEVIILPGLETDGASVPRAFWWYAAPFAGKHAPAALIHDGLYATHKISRETADNIFYEAMLDLGVRKSKAWAMFQSVRKFGSAPWTNNAGKIISSDSFVELNNWKYEG